ncbi:MAG: hypothetical protein V9E99_10230 [Microthrixaceae bacterium]
MGPVQVEVTLPPLDEQRAIADFLDTETARIDALITKKRRLIELLDERYHDVVETRGRRVYSQASNAGYRRRFPR